MTDRRADSCRSIFIDKVGQKIATINAIVLAKNRKQKYKIKVNYFIVVFVLRDSKAFILFIAKKYGTETFFF